MALAISTLLLFVNDLPRFGRHDWLAVLLLALAITGAWAFLRREARAAAPIVNLELFRSLGFALVNIASVLVYLTSFSVLLFVPFYLVRFTRLPLPWAGAVLAASFAGAIAASPLAGRLIERVPARLVTMLGAALGGAGLIAIGSWDDGTFGRTPVILAALVLQGFGVGLFQVAYMDVVIGAMPQRARGVAGSVAMLTRTLGVVSGATLLTLVFRTVENGALAGGQTAPAAFLSAFRSTFYAAGVISILTGVAALALGKRR